MPDLYNMSAINSIRDYVLENKQTLAVAESVTSGHLQAAISVAENASSFFQGGITAYNLGQKCRHLNIEPLHAEQCNCISLHAAEEMAKEVSRKFLSDWGLGITGYAAPVPKLKIEQLFAWLAIAFQGEVLASGKIETECSSAPDSQVDYTNIVLKELADLMKAKAK